MNFDNLPEEMRTLPNWACYRTYTNKEGKRKKVIISPQTGNFAKSNDPNSWADFETASMYKKIFFLISCTDSNYLIFE